MGLINFLRKKLFGFDSHEIALIKKYCPDALTIIEAGAADGSDTVKFSDFFPNSNVYAFEPVSKNFKILSKKVSGLKNVKIFKLALSNKTGTTDIKISSNNSKPSDCVASSSSLLIPKEHLSFHPEIVFDKKEKVKTTTIDFWADKNNIDKIDVVWLDLQGMEYNVLKASPKTIKQAKVIYTEVSLKEMYEGSLLYDDFKKWMKKKGFIVKKEYLNWEDMGNVIFVKEKYVN